MKLGSFSTGDALTQMTLKLFDLLALLGRLFRARRLFALRLRQGQTKLLNPSRLLLEPFAKDLCADGLYGPEPGLRELLFTLLTLQAGLLLDEPSHF